MSEIQVETIKIWMVRYYKGEEKAVLYTDHLAALAEKDKEIEKWKSVFAVAWKQHGAMVKLLARLKRDMYGVKEAGDE